MKQEWSGAVITAITLVVRVAPNSGKHIHKNRPYHGFVLNDTESVKDYCFSDGRVMRTEENTLFYLPKGSSYYVKTVRAGGCFAINFDAEIADEPFVVSLKQSDSLQKSFKIACAEWRAHTLTGHAAAMRAIYDAICQIEGEREQEYMPNERHGLLAPAVDAIEREFADGGLTVVALAELCGISEVYFRRIFLHRFGVSPKEYLIQKRMQYAQQLLCSGELEVSEVARLCGYAEPCHFSREFKKRFGTPPREY